MKNSRNIIVTIMTVFVTTVLNAKQVGQKAGTVQPAPILQPATPVQPVPRPINNRPVEQPVRPMQSAVQKNSYAQALNIVRTGMRSDQVLKNNKFTDYFINFVRNNVQGSDYADVYARSLLEAGAYLHVVLTGDNAIDHTIIDDMRGEIDRHMKLLFPNTMPKSGNLVEQSRLAQATVHVVPTDLRKFNLCPLFGQGGGRYSVFNAQARTYAGKIMERFEYEEVPYNVPCVVQLSGNRTLMQCRTLDQFELADKTGFSPAMCGGLSLNNGRLIRDYALTGNVQNFDKMHSIPDAAQFLRKLKIGDWINPEVLRENLARLQQELGIDGVNVSVIGTVSLFDSQLDKKRGFAAFDQQEFAYVQQVKKVIREGLKQNDYVHIMIIGNAELVEALGHYFCFAIIKKGSEIQYVVLDTIPSAYHLQPGSHERDRLMFVIDNIEKGYSDINVVNLNVKFVEKTF